MEMGQWVMGHGSNGSPFLDGSRGSWVVHCQWPTDPWWWNNCAIACDCCVLSWLDIKKLLTHSISPIIIAAGLILIYNSFAPKTESVVQYYHATPLRSHMLRMEWCNGHGSWVKDHVGHGSTVWWVTKDDPFPIAIRNTSWGWQINK